MSNFNSLSTRLQDIFPPGYIDPHLYQYLIPQPEAIVGVNLKQHQRVGLSWLSYLHSHKLNAILSDEMGLGKTLVAISLMAHLKVAEPTKSRFLVVCPLSVCASWKTEFSRYCPSISVGCFTGSESEIIQEISEANVNVIILPVQKLTSKMGSALALHFAPTLIVADEILHICGHIDRFGNILAQLARSTKAMTLVVGGLPLPTDPEALVALSGLVFHQIIDQTTVDRLLEAPESSETLEFKEMIQPWFAKIFLRRRKTDVLSDSNSSIRYVSLNLPMTELQKALYDDLLNKIPDEHPHVLNMIMALRKILNHPYIYDSKVFESLNDQSELWRASGKFDAFVYAVDKLHHNGNRVVVLAQMTKMLDLMHQYLESQGIEFCRVDGSTPLQEREVQVDKFSSGKVSIILMTTRCGVASLPAASVDTILVYDPDFNSQLERNQLEGLINLGNEKEVLVVRFRMRNSIEAAMFLKPPTERVLTSAMSEDSLRYWRGLLESEIERRHKLAYLESASSPSIQNLVDDALRRS